MSETNFPGDDSAAGNSSLTPVFDHLVVAARTLEEGAAWVEARLGVAPVPGGKHPTMGTHNRLLRIEEALGSNGRYAGRGAIRQLAGRS